MVLVHRKFAGYKEHDMRVTLRNGVLTVTGDRNSEGSETDRVKFNKTFSIFKNYRHEDIHANLANGYLRIILPSNFKTNQTDDQNGYNSWLARTLSELSFDKRLAANAAAFVLVLSGFAVGGYFAFRHV
ncbi:hypothetical protein QQ045_022255 [Rhodiola kirilowii]